MIQIDLTELKKVPDNIKVVNQNKSFLKGITKNNVFTLLNAGLPESELKNVFWGYNEVLRPELPYTDYVCGILSETDEWIPKRVGMIAQNFRDNLYCCAFKEAYIPFWTSIFQRYDISTVPKELVCERKYTLYGESKHILQFATWTGPSILISKSIDICSYGPNGAILYNDIKPFDKSKVDFSGGYTSIITRDFPLMKNIVNDILRSAIVVKDFNYLYNSLGGIGISEITENNIKIN